MVSYFLKSEKKKDTTGGTLPVVPVTRDPAPTLSPRGASAAGAVHPVRSASL